jgi:hypothetical protein
VGYIQGNEVWKVLGTEVLPFPKAILHLTEDQVYYYHRLALLHIHRINLIFSLLPDNDHSLKRHLHVA